ncbi:hypothetical protein [Flavobacterium sp.]|uniref:hypothetical protein n=1 Tax=Flavobacterium sp. TaxID=239 RepID=UPI00352919D0
MGNIIPVCKKIDDPTLFQNDLFLDQLSDVEYYTPFFVQTLRFFSKFTNADYIQALNLFSFFAHFLYGLLWFFLFYKLKKEFWIALLFSFFIRGVIWPPGGELLGISDLWTIMPRTIYTAFLPIPFLIYNSQKKYSLLIASLFLGFIFNFHPISGIGGIIIYFSVFTLFEYYTGRLVLKKFCRQFFSALFFCILGMMPYLLTYLLNVENTVLFNQSDFDIAFFERIPSYFVDPLRFVPYWNLPVLYFFIFLFFSYFFFDSSSKKINFKILFFTFIILFISANASVYIEQLLNYMLNKNIRMSFQLIRFQKFIILIFQVGIYLFVIEILQKINLSNRGKSLIFTCYCVMLICSTMPVFSNIPFISDDLSTSILPNNLKIHHKEKKNYDLSEMIDYIKQNTERNAVFYGDYLIRAGADRSVVLDHKGASMLIEGNPIKLIQWQNDLELMRKLNPTEKIDFLKSKNVNYVVTTIPWTKLIPLKVIGSVYLYKI